MTPAGIDAAINLFKYFSRVRRRSPRRASRPATHPTISRPRFAPPVPATRCSPTSRSSASASCLIIAGNETTTKLLANCLLALQRFPGERAKVVERSRPHPRCDRGDPALRRLDAADGAHAHPAGRAARRAHARGREGAAPARLGEPRRTGVGSARRVRHRPHVLGAARRLRARHPRVPRSGARPLGDAREPRRDLPARCPTTRSTRPAARGCTPATSAAGRRCRSAASA